jgi:hypothetical protein
MLCSAATTAAVAAVVHTHAATTIAAAGVDTHTALLQLVHCEGIPKTLAVLSKLHCTAHMYCNTYSYTRSLYTLSLLGTLSFSAAAMSCLISMSITLAASPV